MSGSTLRSTKPLEPNPHLGWGLFLVMLGVVELLPVPAGSRLIGSGMTLIGLCVQQLWRRRPLSWFTLGLGAVSLVGGIAEVRGHAVPLVPIVLIVVGARILVATAVTRKRSQAEATSTGREVVGCGG